MTAVLTAFEQDNNVKYNNYDTIISILSDISKYSSDFLIAADKNFRIIFSNQSHLKKGDNLYYKLKLKKKHINGTSLNIKRSLIVDKEICPYRLDIIKTDINYEIIYFILLKKIFTQKNFDTEETNLIDFIKHDLKTQLISQIMALKLIIKDTKNNTLLPEILNSAESSYRNLKKYLDELSFVKNEIKICRKETNIKILFEKIKEETATFLTINNNRLNIIYGRNSKAYLDSEKIKDTIVNIIHYINEIIDQNSEINIKSSINHGMFKIIISFPFGKLLTTIFENTQNKTLFYQRNNGLNLAKKIISMHSGKIKIENKDNISTIKIYMPK